MTDKTMKLRSECGLAPIRAGCEFFSTEKGLSSTAHPIDSAKVSRIRRVSRHQFASSGVYLGTRGRHRLSVRYRRFCAISRKSVRKHHCMVIREGRALVTMWERRVEQEGFASVNEAIRNTAARPQGPREFDGPL